LLLVVSALDPVFVNLELILKIAESGLWMLGLIFECISEYLLLFCIWNVIRHDEELGMLKGVGYEALLK